VVKSLQGLVAWLKRLPILTVADIEDAWKAARESHGLSRAAQCAVDPGALGLAGAEGRYNRV
jgi:hypothetical protein